MFWNKKKAYASIMKRGLNQLITCLPKACLFWNEIVLAKIGTHLVSFKSSSPSPDSSSSDSDSGLVGKTWAEDSWPVGVSPSAWSKEFMVAQMCHLAASPATDCALWVTFVALRRHMKSPVTMLMEHNWSNNENSQYSYSSDMYHQCHPKNYMSRSGITTWQKDKTCTRLVGKSCGVFLDGKTTLCRKILCHNNDV